MSSDRQAMAKKIEEDFFRDIIPIAAVEIARDIAEDSGLRGQQFDEEVRWKVQRSLERYLDESPATKSAIFDHGFKNRGSAVVALKGLYRTSVCVPEPSIEVVWDRAR